MRTVSASTRGVSPTGVTCGRHVVFVRSPCRYLSYFMLFDHFSTLLTICTPPLPTLQTLPSVGLRVSHYRTYRTKRGPCTRQMCPFWPHLSFARGSTGLPPSALLSIFVKKSLFVDFCHYFSDFQTRSGRRYPHRRRQQAVYCRRLLICSARSRD